MFCDSTQTLTRV